MYMYTTIHYSPLSRGQCVHVTVCVCVGGGGGAHASMNPMFTHIWILYLEHNIVKWSLGWLQGRSSIWGDAVPENKRPLIMLSKLQQKVCCVAK